MRQARWAVTVGLLLLAAGPAAAADERGAVWVGGGVFAPYDGNPGGTGVVGADGRVTRHVSVGGEVEYRNAQTNVSGLHDVNTNSVNFRGLVRYTWFPGAVHPYVGAGAGVGVHHFDGTVHIGPYPVSVAGTGVGVGVLGLAGLDVPLGDRVSLFAEGRLSGDVETTLFSGDQVGGVSALSGARFTF
jgi:hypothetical protein